MTILNPRRTFGWAGVTLAVLLSAHTLPAAADDTPQAAAPAVSAPCAAADPDVAALIGAETAPAEAALCPAAQAAPRDDVFAKPPFPRYCKCGCGARCLTDADCGPGGVCVGFITCC